MSGDGQDWTPAHGIPRPPAGELVLRRRLRILREILEDVDSPFRSRLIDLTDMVEDTDAGIPMPRMVPATGRRIDLLGSPPPRQRKER
jgi:hypothetical protein